MDNERFIEACKAACERGKSGIGTLSEKGVHNALKHYFEPDEGCHEVEIGGYVADIVGENGIIEIQTQRFSSMRSKLEQFLRCAPVTIVYPCITTKRLVKIDKDTGEVLSKRKSPDHRSEYDLFDELWGIKELVNNDRLTICVVKLEAEEYRIDIPKEQQKRRWGAKRTKSLERMPTALLDMVWIHSLYDYRSFLPTKLPEPFTTSDLASAAGIPLSLSQSTLGMLNYLGIVERVGKRGNAYLYKLTPLYGDNCDNITAE